MSWDRLRRSLCLQLTNQLHCNGSSLPTLHSRLCIQCIQCMQKQEKLALTDTKPFSQGTRKAYEQSIPILPDIALCPTLLLQMPLGTSAQGMGLMCPRIFTEIWSWPVPLRCSGGTWCDISALLWA